jgi:hypothetical protein
MFFMISAWKQLRNGLYVLYVMPSVVTNWRITLISFKNFVVVLKSFVTMIWKTEWMEKFWNIRWFVVGRYCNTSAYLWGLKSAVLTAVLLKIQGLWAVLHWPVDVSTGHSAFNFRVKYFPRLGLLDSEDRCSKRWALFIQIHDLTFQKNWISITIFTCQPCVLSLQNVS